MRPTIQSSYIRSARQKHAAQRSYFDDDSEDELLAAINTPDPLPDSAEDEIDPLDAYMQEVHTTIAAPVVPEAMPEVVSEQLYDDYEAYYDADAIRNEVTIANPLKQFYMTRKPSNTTLMGYQHLFESMERQLSSHFHQ